MQIDKQSFMSHMSTSTRIEKTSMGTLHSTIRPTTDCSARSRKLRIARKKCVSIASPRRFKSAFAVIACGMLSSATLLADVPVSIGTTGAHERAALTIDAAQGGTSASFGTPRFDESNGFSLRWRFPLYAMGAEEDEDSLFSGSHQAVATPSFLNLGGNAFALNVEDFASAASYIPAIEIGQERGPMHFQIGALSSNIGHGSQVHEFTNSPIGAERKMGLLFELNSASLGGQVAFGDITSPTRFISGRIYGRPLLWYVSPDSLFHPNELDVDPRSEVAGIWVTGVSAAVDAIAPTREENITQSVYTAGWDNELAVLDRERFKAIGYLDLNLLGGTRREGSFGTPLGFGAHPGIRLLANIPVLGSLSFNGEYNAGSHGYVPRYFDRLYFLERDSVLGTDLAKSSIDAPASHGYMLRFSANVLDTVSLFLEAKDQFAFDPTEGANSAEITLGASFFYLFFGGGLNIAQAGIQEYGAPDFFDAGFVVTADGRVALVANIFHIVGRYYRVHEPGQLSISGTGTDYEVLQGAMIGLELNLDFGLPMNL
jgi:hypothetical protein